MDPTPVPVRNADQLLAAFGYWPSFHDAEVHNAELDRGNAEAPPPVTLALHVFDYDGTVDERGYYRIRTSVLVTLRFNGISNLELRDFGPQNVIMGLQLNHEVDGGISVELSPSYGLSGSFSCVSIDVIESQAWPEPPPSGEYAPKITG